jgi:hypothetical protein
MPDAIALKRRINELTVLLLSAVDDALEKAAKLAEERGRREAALVAASRMRTALVAAETALALPRVDPAVADALRLVREALAGEAGQDATTEPQEPVVITRFLDRTLSPGGSCRPR